MPDINAAYFHEMVEMMDWEECPVGTIDPGLIEVFASVQYEPDRKFLLGCLAMLATAGYSVVRTEDV